MSFTLRSKGEGGQPRYLIIQEIASHSSIPPAHPPPPPRLPRTLRADSKHCNLQYVCSFRIKKPHFVIWWNIRKYQCFCYVLAKNHCKYRAFCCKKHRKYRGFGLPIHPTHSYLRCFLLRKFQNRAKTLPM